MLNGCSVQQIARVPAAIAIDASPQQRKTFVYTGKAQPFTVPSYLIKITVIVIGARGTGAPVTYGGRVRATIPVTGGKKLVVFVGGQGSGAIGGFNGGGNSCTSSARDCGYGGGAPPTYDKAAISSATESSSPEAVGARVETATAAITAAAPAEKAVTR